MKQQQQRNYTGGVLVFWLAAAALLSVALATTGTNSTSSPPTSAPLLLREREGLCASKLGAFVDQLLQRAENRRALYGILVRKVSSGSGGKDAPLYAHNAASRFTPASNTKLFSAGSLFLHADATSFRYSTPFLFRHSSAQLCVRGGADPSLAHTDLVTAAAAIKKSVGRVSELIVDNSLFRGDGQPFPSSWEWDDLNWDYGAEPEAVIVEENAITLTISPGHSVGQPLTIQYAIDGDRDAVEVRNAAVTLPAGAKSNLTTYYPPGNSYLQVAGGLPVGAKPNTLAMGVLNSTSRFANLFRHVLKSQSVAVDRVAFGECRGADWATLYTHKSQPLSVLMDHCLQISDNLYAEVFARTLGAMFTPAGEASGSTLNDGLALIAKTLVKLGVERDSFDQADGSGLSRHNMLSPESLVDALNGLQTTLPQEKFKLFRSFLPLAGKSGSLINRFKGTPAEGKVWAKTGSMTGVSSLSGYAENAQFPHQTLIFSVIVNGNTLGQSAARTVIDAIVEELVVLRDC